MSKFKIDEEFEEKVRERAKVIHHNEIDNETTIFEEIDDSNNAIQGEVIDRAADAMEDLTAANRQILEFDTMDQLQSDYKSLNIDQRRIVDKVLAIINGGNTQKSLKMFVSGFGGTGKSRVIDVTRRMLCNQFSKEICPVVVMAPTGLVASSIKGVTIHRCLSLPVDKQTTAKYTSLSIEQLLTLRKTLSRTRLFIIDEISMVSSLMMMYIHLRLTEIMSNNLSMRNSNCVLFDDLLQLRPFLANPPYASLTRLEIRNRIGSIGTFELRKEFDYDELTINMRQKTTVDRI